MGPAAKRPERMGRLGVDCALKRRLRRNRQRNEGRHVDLALYACMWGRRLFERRSHSDGARRAAPAPIAKIDSGGPWAAGGPGPPAFVLCTIGICLAPMPALSTAAE